MRRCAYRNCRKPLGTGRRTTARFCDDRCRAKEWKKAHGSSGGPRVTVGTLTGASQTPSGDGSVPRRSTRDGTGAHLYVLEADLAEIEAGPPYPPRVLDLLGRARGRIERSKNGTRNSGATAAPPSSR